MTRLARVELRRLFARRLTRIGLAATVLVTGLLAFTVWQESKPLPEQEQRQIRAQYESMKREMVAQCQAPPGSGETGSQGTGPGAALDCESQVPPLEEWMGQPETVFAESMPDYLVGASYLAMFAVFLIAAGFIGAEFTTGSIGNWLTFEPRRLRVYATKVFAAATGPLPVVAGLLAAFTAACWLIVDHNGSTAGTTSQTWTDLGGMAGRAVVLAAAAGVAGIAVGGLLRHTAAAIGVAMAYLVLVEGVFGSFLDQAQPWLLRANLDGWLRHGTTYQIHTCDTGPDGGYACQLVDRSLSFGHSAAFLGVALVTVLMVGATAFHRRDVT